MSWLDCLTAGGPASSDTTPAALASIRWNFGRGFLVGGDRAEQQVDVSGTVVGEWAVEVDLTSSDRDRCAGNEVLGSAHPAGPCRKSSLSSPLLRESAG
jgi:hypothetical protein